MKHNDQSLSVVAGANLKRLIKEAKLTQEQAAEKLLLSEASCVRRLIRNGISNIDDIQRIADIFGVTLYEMLTPID